MPEPGREAPAKETGVPFLYTTGKAPLFVCCSVQHLYLLMDPNPESYM